MRRHVGWLTAMVLTATALTGAAGGPAAARGPQTEHDRVVAHWTKARMKAAIPRDFVRDPKGRLKPSKGKPGGGGSTTTSTVTGASWTGGGSVVDRTGKVYFEMGGTGYICSGTIVTDGRTNRSLVLTAAHCAYDEQNKAFAENWMFIPAFDTAPSYTCSRTKYGCWTAEALVVHQGFATAGSFNEQAILHDFAFAVVGLGGIDKKTELDKALGAYEIDTGSISAGFEATAFGYPAAGKYRGNDLVYCKGPTSTDPWMNGQTWSIACDMTGGSSGGSWMDPFTNGSGTIRSLNSYGYSGVKNMYGPRFNDDTAAVYAAAGTATGDTTVP